jgi:tRNA(Ile)-lysidine synthase
MLSRFEKKVACFVKAEGLGGSAGKLLLALSGGADSTALLYAMQKLRAEKVLKAELLCAHANHQLRGGDADLDEEFVVAQAKELGLPATARRIDVRGYARLNKLSNAETVLQRLARGTGFRGLAGIWPERIFDGGTKFIRPLLCVRRDEIIEYLQERNLKWRRDHTNADCAHRRNYIRHRLLPEVQRQCADSLVERLFELSNSARKFYDSVCGRADELWPDLADFDGREIKLDLKMFLPQTLSVQVECIRRSLACIGCGERDLARHQYEGILALAARNVTGRKMELPGGFGVCREYGNLIFTVSRSCTVGQAPPYGGGEPVRLNVPGRTRFGEFMIEATIVEVDDIGLGQIVDDKTSSVERFDLERVKLPLIVRSRRPGDRFVPLGLTSEKKIGKFLTAQRIPHRLRERVLVVADGEKIIWVWPVRMSERVKVSGQTGKILQLRITDLSDRQNSVDSAGQAQ